MDLYVDQSERESFLQQMARGGYVRDEVWFRRKDGTQFMCERSATAQYGAHGEIVMFQGIFHDVTGERHAERVVRDSEQRLSMFFSQSYSGSFFMMLDEPIEWNDAIDKEKALDYVFAHQRMTQVNQAMLDQYGAKEEEFIGLTPGDLFQHDLAHGRHIWRGLFDRGRWLVEASERRRDGSPIIIGGDYICLYDEQGRITGHFGLQTDITEQKRAHAALRGSEERYRALIDQSVEMIYLHDVDGTILEVNPAATSWTGYSRNELLQMTVFDLHTDASGREDIVHQWKAWQPGIPVTLETAHKRKDGSIRQVEVTPGKLLIGDAHLILALVRDITERKAGEQALRESEDKYRTLFEQSRDAIYIATPDGKSLDWNQAWLDLLGYTREEFSRLSTYDIYTDPASRDDHVKRLERQGHVQDDECRLRRKDGTVLDCLCTVTIRRDAEGRSIAYQGIVRDVTGQKRDQEELDASRMELQALAARLEEIREIERTGIARELHDQVGQALTALKMDLDAVRRALERGEEDPLARLNSMADLLDGTVNDVRRISSELRPGILDDAGLAAAMEWQLDRLRERSTLHCSIEVQADDSVLTPPQSTALFRVFQELLTNVVRHAAAGSVSVTLSSDCNRFALTVADDGRGITDEQADDAGSLGLIGIRERLRPLGGEIRFSGASGKGTNVCVTVPLR